MWDGRQVPDNIAGAVRRLRESQGRIVQNQQPTRIDELENDEFEDDRSSVSNSTEISGASSIQRFLRIGNPEDGV